MVAVSRPVNVHQPRLLTSLRLEHTTLTSQTSQTTHHHDRAPVVRGDDLNNVDRGGEDTIAKTNKNSARKVIKYKYKYKYRHKDEDKDKYRLTVPYS